MNKLRFPTNKEEHLYMKWRKNQNIAKSLKNESENWFDEKIKPLGIKYSRQAVWGYRVFDFWFSGLGIAVEIDGNSHNKEYDAYRDEYNFKRSGIIVLRVRNKNENDAEKVISQIMNSDTWLERREKMDLLTKAQKKNLKNPKKSRC